jgi:phosphoenolpyruvate---glycerone phosphotransferase subunit DhaM
VVGIVVVSHSSDLASGLAELAGQVAGSDVRIEAAGGGPNDTLGTDEQLVRDAIARADQGDGVVVLCDLGSAVLTVRHLLDGRNGNGVVLADAPLVEGAVAAAVVSSAGSALHDVAKAAEEARGASKL